MRNYLLSTAAFVILVHPFGFAQHPTNDNLLQELQVPEESNQAFAEIEKYLSANQGLRSELLSHLPAMMAKEQDSQVLANESRLAGELKVRDCIPSLLALYRKGDQVGIVVTLSRIMRLADDPAGEALVKIGDPSIPSLKSLLASSNPIMRRKAVLVFVNINSAASRTALREHRPHETDPYLQHTIDSNQEQPSIAPE